MADSLSTLQERYQQTLNNIASLQIQEREMYDSLSDVTLSADQKDQIINKINGLAQMRSNLYSTMNDTYSFYSDMSSTSKKTFEQELTAISIVDEQLKESRKKLASLRNEKLNKLHSAEINTYYSQRYQAHTKVLKTIIFICVIVVILTVLAKKGILPKNLYVFITGTVIVIVLFNIGRQLIDLSNRDNIIWDEYNWYFDKSSAPSDTTGDNTDPWANASLTCVGQECCYAGSTYSSDTNQCIPDA